MSDIEKLPLCLRASYLAMHRQTNARLARLGITADQFVCMLILYDHDGIIQKELAERATSDQNTVRAMLVLLEAKGYVQRRRHPEDGRARVVGLTSAGRRTTEKALLAVRGVHDRIRSRISEEEAGVLNEFLLRLSGD